MDSVALTVRTSGMVSPLQRLTPRLKQVDADVPDWLLQAAGRSQRFHRRRQPRRTTLLWLPLDANSNAAVELVTCSDLTSGLSHDVSTWCKSARMGVAPGW